MQGSCDSKESVTEWLSNDASIMHVRKQTCDSHREMGLTYKKLRFSRISIEFNVFNGECDAGNVLVFIAQ